MALDHGILNTPLSKRGDIDAQIDRYKAEQKVGEKAAAKASAKETKELRAEAKAAAAGLTYEWYAWHADRLGVKVGALRKLIKSESHWNPRLAIEMIRQANAMYRGQF